MSDTILVGVSGYARSGKDSAGLALLDVGWQRRSFADKLKAVLYDLDPLLPPLVEGGPMIRLARLVDMLGWEAAKDSHPEVRPLLQRLGVSARQQLHPDVWVDAGLRCVGDTPTVVTDVRFPNEADGIRDRGGIVVRVERPGVGPAVGPDGTIHVSETALDDYDFDHLVRNDGTLADLAEHIGWIVCLAGWGHTLQGATQAA